MSFLGRLFTSIVSSHIMSGSWMALPGSGGPVSFCCGPVAECGPGT